MATGHEELDAELVVDPRLRILGQVLYREAVAPKASRSGVDTVVLACSLPGGADLAQVIYDLRRLDMRVILLAGDREGADGRLLSQAVGLGVYDLLFDPVRPDDVAQAVLQPAGFAGAAAWLEESGEQGARPAPGPVAGRTPRQTALPKNRGRPAPTLTPTPPMADAEPLAANTQRHGTQGNEGAEGSGQSQRPRRTVAPRWSPLTRLRRLPRRPDRSAGHPATGGEQSDPGRMSVLAEAGEVYRIPALKAPGRVIIFTSPRAGVGRSFLAGAFGMWLAGQQEAVALADLDGGDFRWNLGSGRQSRGGTLCTHPSGLGIVRGTAATPLKLVNELAAEFRTVIVTLSAAGREDALEVLTGAARIFLVATPERKVLCDVMREFYYYRHLELDPEVAQLVLNRLGRYAKIRPGEVGGLLPPALCTVVPESGLTPEEALQVRRFRRCMEDLGRGVAAESRACGRWSKPCPAGT